MSSTTFWGQSRCASRNTVFCFKLSLVLPNSHSFYFNSQTMAEPQKFPILVHLWARVLDSVPAVPFFGLDVGLTIVSMVFLTIVRYTALHVLEYVWDWPSAAEEDRTWMAASSFSSITHSSMLCPALFSCLISQPYRPHAPMPDGAADRPWRKAVTALLQFCTGYMVYDAVINIVLPKYPNLTGTDYM